VVAIRNARLYSQVQRHAADLERSLAELQRADRALREGERRTSAIVETARDAFVSIDAAGYITGWNEQAELTFGWNRAEVQGRSLAETIIPPAYREAHRAGLARYASTGESHIVGRRLELVAQHRDGHEFPVELTISGVRSGPSWVFNAFVRDITERRRAERRRALLASASSVLAECSRLEEAAPRLLRAVGEVAGSALAELWLEGDDGAPRLHGMWHAPGVDPEAVVRTEEAASWVVPVAQAGQVLGSMRFFDRPGGAVDEGLAEAAAEVGHHLALFVERARAEEMLKRSEARYRQIVESAVTAAPVAMAVLDRDLAYVAHSARWARFWKLEPPLVGRPDPILSALPGKYRQAVARTLAGELVSEREDAYVRGDGTSVYLRWAMHPWRDARGGVQGLVVVVESIHELVRARQAAEEAARIKSEFLATVSHEIRTPLHGVLGMTRLLCETALDPHQREYVEMIRGSGQVLLQVVNDILDFSRAESGRIELEPMAFDVRAMVEEVLASFAERAAAKDLALAAVVEPAVPSWVWGDPARVGQVLANLIANAVRFTDAGEVVVRVAPAEAAPEAAPEAITLRFVVSDTGIGIAPDSLPRLFRSYAQVHRERRHGGSGLGLAICQRLVELMGGAMEVQSRPGLGSTFSFTARFERRAAAAAPEPATAELAGRRVLVCEPHPATAEGLRQALEEWGMHVVEAPGWSQALEACRSSEPPVDVALVDARLPRAEGGGLSELAAAAPRAGIVLLVPVGFGGAASPRAGLTVTRPVRRAQLRASLLDALAVSPAAGPTESAPSPPAACAAAARPRILVADDSEVGRLVLVRTLERLGYDVVAVEDGLQAVEACARGSFAAVLMDARLPVLDGLEATARIRAAESAGVRTPIVAVTASALDADRARCREAGMDDFVSKPVALEELQRVLGRWVRRPPQSGPADEEPSLDRTALDDLRGLAADGSGRVLDEVVRLFLSRVPQRLASMTEAARAGDAATLENLAHALKTSCANVGARRMSALCERLEEAGRSGALAEVPGWLEAATRELAVVRRELEAEIARGEGRQTGTGTATGTGEEVSG
jgi:PAS domain S-box-containing protein